MKLLKLQKELETFLQESVQDVERNPLTATVLLKNYSQIRDAVSKVRILNVFESEEFTFLEGFQPVSNQENTFIGYKYDSFERGLQSLRSSAEFLLAILSKITQADDPYQFDIELAENISTMNDLEKFNEKLADLCKAIQAVTVDDKAICHLKFHGFEKGSNYVQFVVEAGDSLDIDTVFAYLNAALNVAREFLILLGMWTGHKLVSAKAKSWLAEARLKNAEAALKEAQIITDDDKKNFIKNEIEQQVALLGEKIQEVRTIHVINKFIELMEAGNKISPSLAAPSYVTQDEEKIAIDMEKLAKTIANRHKPKELENNLKGRRKQD